MEAQIKYIAAAITALIFSVIVTDIMVIWLMTKAPKKEDEGWWNDELMPITKDTLPPGATRKEWEELKERLSKGPRRKTVNERSGRLPIPEAEWHPGTMEIPLKMRVDIKTKKQIYEGVILVSKKPPIWRPAFIKYKKIIEWRYSEPLDFPKVM